MGTKLTKLLQSGLTVFTLDDLGIIWGQKDRLATRQSARDYASRGSLARLRQGVYALPHTELDTYVVANKLLAPSYVTGLSVLAGAGLSFQYTNRVFSVAAYNKSHELGERTFVYSQVKASVLFNPLGLNSSSTASVAGVERAITDLIYLSRGRYPFEVIKGIDWGLLADCATIYGRAYVPRAVERLKEGYA
jgi:predicted transcriptional regulator of viral defense system